MAGGADEKKTQSDIGTVQAPGLTPFHRPARIFPAPLQATPVKVSTPPTVPTPPGGSILQVLFPIVGSLGMVGFALIYRNALFLAIAGGIAVLMLTLSIGMRVQQKRSLKKTRQKNAARYRDYLAARGDDLAAIATRQRDSLNHVHPPAEVLWSIVNSHNQLWERRRNDPDFMELRIGRGEVPLAAPIDFDLGHDPLVEHEPELLEEAKATVDRYAELEKAPITVGFGDLGAVALVGPPREVRDLARALLTEITVMHAPDDVRIVALFPPETIPEWGWLKWLPHARASLDAPAGDAVAVSLAVDPNDFEILLTQVIKPRLEHLDRVRNQPGEDPISFQQVVVLIDESSAMHASHLPLYEEMLRRAPEIGLTPMVLLTDPRKVPSTVGARLEIAEGGWLAYTRAGRDGERLTSIRADATGTEICEAIARGIAPLRLRLRRDQARRVDSESLLDLLHINTSADLAPSRLWQTPEKADLLATPIGIAEDGSHITLDLKESAEDGMGPHGLIVGATGSGKSELLRTLVCGLALKHSPEDLAFVLVDYKGGATFAELASLPHCAGMITNIENDLTLVDRMHEALFGELERRQRLLQSMGHFDGAREYQEYRAEHPDKDLPPLPSLLVIVDEFGELLTSRPDFLELFVSIGRTGRSLGVHLLLSTQRLDEGRIRGLEGHLRYRICLRTFSAEESVLALGSRDAFEMPPLPGLGYLRVDGSLTHFKAALSTRPYREHRDLEEIAPRVVRDFEVVQDGDALAVVLGDRALTPSRTSKDQPYKTEMQVVVDRLRGDGDNGRVRQVWLPPLPKALTLDDLSDVWDKTTEPGAEGWLRVPVGLLDHPREQDQLPAELSFAGREGNLAVVGAPRSGKSVFLQTMAATLALTHDPADVQIYAVDLGGGSLHALRELPHVGEVYGRSDRDGILRLIRELASMVAERTVLFRREGLSGIEAYHEARRAGTIKDDGYGEVFLLIDNWALLVQEFEDLQYTITDFATGALHYGVHLVVTSSRWNDIRLALRDNIGGRLELRLNDPIESEIDRHAAKALPGDVPGRAIDRDGQQLQIALPRTDGRADISGLKVALETITGTVLARWEDSTPAPEIRMLPSRLLYGEVEDDPRGMVYGIEEFGLEPVALRPDGIQPHLLVFGDSGAGKTNLLRVLLRGITKLHGPEGAQIAVVDYRRQLLPETQGLDNVVAFAANQQMAGELGMRLTTELSGRLAGEDLTTEPAAWSGTHLYLLIDDYDLVASSTNNPLLPLLDLLAQGRDIGLHVIVARRVGGTTRSSFEPFFQRLVEIGTPGLIMTGEPQEGPLIGGVKAQPLPPGRGTLVGGGRAALVQTVLIDEDPGREPL